MEKRVFNVRILGNDGTELRPVPGYIFLYGGLRFAVTNKANVNNQVVDLGAWSITELTTGCSVGRSCTKATRQGAIDALIKEHAVTLDAIRAGIDRQRDFGLVDDANPHIYPKTEWLTIYPA